MIVYPPENDAGVWENIGEWKYGKSPKVFSVLKNESNRVVSSAAVHSHIMYLQKGYFRQGES